MQRAQDEPVHDPENHCVCANRQRQRQNRGDGETRRLAQHAQCESHILQKSIEESVAHGVAAFFLVLLPSAEFDARAALCLGTIKAGTFQIVGTVLDVRAKFLLHLGVDLGTLEESSHAEAKRIEEFHVSSGCTESAEAMAAASRFQLSVSSRRPLRPAAVSS
jgi:hypothetical protein